MVTIARYLNVTLTVLELDKISFWYDSSEFKDIFDVDYIVSLRDEVWVLKELPPRLKRRAELGYVHSMPPISRSDISYYQNQGRIVSIYLRKTNSTTDKEVQDPSSEQNRCSPCK